MRVAHQHLFTGGRDTAINGYRTLIEQLELTGRVTPLQAKKKWDNLKTKYKDCKCPASGQGTEDGGPTAGTWRWFALMDELIGRSAAVSPPVVVGSLPARPGQVRVRVEDEVVGAGTSTATTAGAASTATAAEAASTATAAGAGAEGAAGAGAGRRGREDPFLILVGEDILYQWQADERREVESRERFDRFFSLLERLVERRE
ncbi:unnamed protein product [Arctogadus glacialis]